MSRPFSPAELQDIDWREGLEGSGEAGSAAAPDPVEPVDLWGSFQAPELPRGLLPPIIEHWAFTMAKQMGCDPAGLAMAALATCAAAIPDQIQLKVKRHDDWRESARIWVALVGSPSTKKSPMFSASTGPLCSLDIRLMRQWQAKMAEWLALPKEEKKGVPQPPQTRLRLEDATIESAQQVLEGSPWGVLMLQDEMSGFFGSMDKYSGARGASADRAFWLRAFNGGHYAVNRVGRGASIIENCSVSMLGGIQPEPLRKVAADSVDDGLLQRLFPIMLKDATLGEDKPMPPVASDYANLIERLHRLSLPQWELNPVLRFDDDAQRMRAEIEQENLRLQGVGIVNRKLAAHIGKYEGLWARLCLIWHCIEQSASAADLMDPISAHTARRVADFLHGFLLGHASAFYNGTLGMSDDQDRLADIAGHILAHGLEIVTNRTVQRGCGTTRGLKDFEVHPLLEQLEALGWLDRTEGPRATSAPHFRVNPRVHARFAERAEIEAKRRKEGREAVMRTVRS